MSTYVSGNSDAASRKLHAINSTTIYICGAIGGFIAAIADVVQKEEASAVVKLTSLSARLLDLAVRPVSVLFGLVLLGTLLCFVFQPRDRKTGFSVGVGVIALIMTVTPYKTPPTGLPSSPEVQTEASIDLAFVEELVFTDSFPIDAIIPQPKKLLIRFNIENTFETPETVTILVFDGKNRQEYRQKHSIKIKENRYFYFELPYIKSQSDNENYINYSVETTHTPVIRIGAIEPSEITSNQYMYTANVKIDLEPLEGFSIEKPELYVRDAKKIGATDLGRTLQKTIQTLTRPLTF